MNAGWHPAPDGSPSLWYWDGQRWIDPIAQVEEMITELITPHLERAYLEGFKAGLAQRQEENAA